MIRENQKVLNRIHVASDGLLVFCAYLLGYWFRFFVLKNGVDSYGLQSHILVGILLIPLHLLTCSFFGLYESQRGGTLWRELSRLLTANMLDLAVLLMCFFLFRGRDFSRLQVGIFGAVNFCLMAGKRIVLRFALRKLRASRKNLKHLILIGSGEDIRRCHAEITGHADLGYEIIGIVAEEAVLSDVPFLGTYDRLDSVLRQYRPDEAIAGLKPEEYDKIPQIIDCCENCGVKFSLIPFYARYFSAHPQMDRIYSLPVLNLRRIPLDNLGNAFVKRLGDIVGSLLLILLSSPVMLVVSVGVKLSSPGPVLFRQERVGLNQKPFTMYKFRSMRVNSGSDTRWTTNNDERKTRFGSLIRKYSLDELPQFFNVLLGDMSLIGPRPEIPHFVEQFRDEIPLYMVKHQVKPGITGWAQVNGFRGDTSIQKRIEYDIDYIENWSVWMDLKILFLTVFKGMANEEKLAKREEKEYVKK